LNRAGWATTGFVADAVGVRKWSMSTEYNVDPETLALQLIGLLPEDRSHVRQVLFEEIESRFPDGDARVNIQISELNPGRTATWHIHNGVVYFVLLRGLISLQYEGRIEHYTAGDVYTEPVGVVHRAVNPHPDIPAALVGFWVTPADRPHLTESPAPEWIPTEGLHPSL
jgi:quercetin dioxygenase-like cupin family protein